MNDEKKIPVKVELLISWVEALGYAFDDVDLNYEDEEAREQVKAVYDEVRQLLKDNDVDYMAVLQREPEKERERGKEEGA